MIISQLEIRLSAGIARLQQDLDNARRAVDNSMDRISASVAGAMKMFAGLAAGLSVAALAGFVKSSIDAVDALNDMSVRTKVAIEDLAGLAYGAKLSDTSLEGVAGSITKLGQNIGKEGAKFRALGITATEPLEAFKQLADVFKDIKDPQQRAAFGAEALSKSWQEAAVLLESGADGISNLIDQGKSLSGITEQVAADAGAFNDKLDELGFAAKGAGTRIVAGLLPTLQKMADSFSSNAVNGDALANTVTALSATLKGLYSVGIGVSALFVGLGKSIGGTAAVAVAALSGDFAGALATYKEMATDVYSGLGDAAIRIGKLWVDTGKDTSEAVTSWTDAASDSTAKVTAFLNSGEIKAARDKAAAQAEAAARKEQAAYAGVIVSIREKTAASQAEIAGAAPLTAVQQLRIKLDEELAAGKVILTSEHIKELHAMLDNAEALEGAARGMAGYLKIRQEYEEQVGKSILAATEEAAKNEELVAVFGMTKKAIEQMELARLQDQLAQRSSTGLTLDEIDALEKLIVAKNRNAVAVGALDALEAQKKASDEAAAAQVSFWKSIDDTAHATFVSIANGSKDTAQRLKDTFKNVFFDWLYQQTIKKWFINVGMVGTTSVAGAAESAAGGGAGGLGGLINAGKSIYEGFSSGFMSLAGSLGSGISSLGAAFGSEAVAAFGAGLQGGALGSGTASAASGYAGTTAAGYGAAAAPYVAGLAGVAGGIYGGRAISGGYGSNGAVNTGTAIGAVIGSVVPGLGTALGALVGGLLGGATNRLFGMAEKKVVSTMLDGMLTPTGATANNVSAWTQKGGVFRSNKSGTDTTALTGEQTAVFATAYKGILDLSKTFGDALGVETAGLSTRMQKLSIDFKGLTTDAEKGAAVTKFFEGVANTVAAELVPSIAKFAAEGEAASATLVRLATDYRNVDDIFSAIGASIKQTGLGGIEMREGLIAAAGGLDALAAGVGYVQQNFISEADRLAQAQTQLADGLSGIGYSALKTKDDFKAAVQGFDWTREGAADLFVQLLALAPAFKEVTDATDAAAQAVREQVAALAQVNAGYQDQIDKVLAARQGEAAVRALEIKGMDASTIALYDRLNALKAEDAAIAASAQATRDKVSSLLSNVDEAFSVLQRVVEREKDANAAAHAAEMKSMQVRIDASTAAVTKIMSLSDSLKSSLDSMNVSGTGDSDARAVGRAQIQAALAIAKAGGPLPTADSLKQALSSVTKDASDKFATYDDYLTDFYKTQNEIAALGKVTDAALSVEQRTLGLLQSQKDANQTAYEAEIARLNELVESTRAQIDVMNGMDTSLLTIDQTLQAVLSAILKAQANPVAGAAAGIAKSYQEALGRAPDKAGMEFWQQQAAAGTSMSDINSAIKGSGEAKIQALYKDLLGRSADAGGLKFYLDAINSGVSLGSIEAAIKGDAEYKKLHPFAVGTNYVPRDMPAYLHEGEGVIPAADNRELMSRLSAPAPSSNAELIAELRAQREEERAENDKLRAVMESHLYQIAKSTRNTADVLEGAANGAVSLAVAPSEEA